MNSKNIMDLNNVCKFVKVHKIFKFSEIFINMNPQKIFETQKETAKQIKINPTQENQRTSPKVNLWEPCRRFLKPVQREK